MDENAKKLKKWTKNGQKWPEIARKWLKMDLHCAFINEQRLASFSAEKVFA